MSTEINPAPVTTIATLGQHEGQTITLRGWLYNLRSSGKLLFPTFRDGSGTIQGIVPKAAVAEEVFETLKNLTLESSVVVTGKVRADSRAPSGFELDVENVTVTQRIADETPYPISLKEHGVDFLMEHRHLWLRTPRQSAILRVRATIMRAAAEYFDTNGFIRTDPPILTPNACEGTSELFEMDYFDDDKAYLTQSGQLYIEATALALGKVYSFGPTFRAEKSKTRRHLTEFWMIEPEVTYLDLDGLMGLAEGFLTHIVTRVLETHRADLKVIGKEVSKLEAVAAPGEFPRLSYDEAHQMLVEAHAKGLIENAHTYGDDFGSPDETYISNQFDKPVMVHRYPAEVKAFYMQPDPNDPTKALCVDVLAPEGYGEIIGGSQRVDSYDLLKSRIEQHNLPLAAFQWYLDLRKYGSVPHSGFGMGIERAVAWICGLEHVRETIPFARTLNRIYP
ncbi:asparagine--tRNA ligase [Granulicella mallensis]|uniref:Asparagine--tRNA ligase n=1 Tax=Granulicella mallensis (strain ATCC BAA-1857 / DSM 23137 / MP5ACTX8) TaxID=682795 RepID=G8NXS3_GRAMM|nr:asparagine--tRNA ligase [Granulicella mallensis]AEU34418.1 asparaginyl-tRNA synthetase [Granulicella mallensis MP5ACTX8]